MKQPKAEAPDREKKDVLDHIEEFIENHIEKNIKKGLDEVEKFVKKELLKQGTPGQPGPIAYIEALLKDSNVAALHPSTKFVVERIVKMIDWPSTRIIIEYGPAKGVITKRLLSLLPEDGILVAIETNDAFVQALHQIKDPRLKVVHGSAMEVDSLVKALSIPPADVIVSGIPFSYFKPIQRHQLLHKTDDLLGPKGRFIAYQVTTHLVPLMKYHFEDLDVQFEIRNLPPHFVFTGYKK